MKKSREFHIIDGFKNVFGRQRPVHNAAVTPAHPADSFASHTLDAQLDIAAALKASEQRLSMLLHDRDRIGRDLHDCILQSLYAIGLNLQTSQRVRPAQSSEERESTAQAIVQINRLIHEVRSMIREMEGGIVRNFSLTTELEALCKSYERGKSLQIKLDLQRAALDVLTNEEEREILNILREALSNCVRHAKASKILVSIRLHGTRVQVGVRDDGMGFTTTAHDSQGYGLTNMAARAKKLGGHLTIRSHIGRGTKIIAEFGLEPILTSV